MNKKHTRPNCQMPGCTNLCAAIRTNKKTGHINWRKYCGKCHNIRTASKHGLKNIAEVVAKKSGFSSVSQYLNKKAKDKGFDGLTDYLNKKAKDKGFDGLTHYRNKQAQDKGFDGLTEYRNSIHPSRSKRKDYCENIDGRLGFVCTYPVELPPILGVKFKGHLQVDHINGDPRDNREVNLQTLCACCHSYKTILYKDSSTPGRKTLKKKQDTDNSEIKPDARIHILVDIQNIPQVLSS